MLNNFLFYFCLYLFFNCLGNCISGVTCCFWLRLLLKKAISAQPRLLHALVLVWPDIYQWRPQSHQMRCTDWVHWSAGPGSVGPFCVHKWWPSAMWTDGVWICSGWNMNTMTIRLKENVVPDNARTIRFWCSHATSVILLSRMASMLLFCIIHPHHTSFIQLLFPCSFPPF